MRILLAGFVFVVGCSTPPPQVVTIKEPVEVKVPIPVACIFPEVPKPKWEMDNPQLQKENIFVLGIAALRELEQRRAYEAELEAASAACKKTP